MFFTVVLRRVNLHPGTNGGTGNCLEAGAGYFQNVGQGPPATPVFWIGDFCNLSGGNGLEAYPVQWLMNSSFGAAYTANFGDGFPRITIELMQPTSDPNTNDWYAFIYDYGTSTWEKVYETGGNFLTSYVGTHSTNPQIGWSLDGAHFNASTYTDCPSVPTFSETGIQVADESSGNDANNFWRPLQPTDYSAAESGYCFYNDGSPTGAIYTGYTYYDQWNYPAWRVTDPAPAPTSTPERTPPPCIRQPCPQIGTP
jgi:hypothetical protein